MPNGEAAGEEVVAGDVEEAASREVVFPVAQVDPAVAREHSPAVEEHSPVLAEHYPAVAEHSPAAEEHSRVAAEHLAVAPASSQEAVEGIPAGAEPTMVVAVMATMVAAAAEGTMAAEAITAIRIISEASV